MANDQACRFVLAWPMRSAVLLGACLLAATPLAAQQGYSTWSDPKAKAVEDNRVQTLIDELGGLIDKADQARAADPRFLGDLRDLVRRYDRPWRKLLLADDFGDGDFTANPPWQVTAGSSNIEAGWGLRSFVEPRARAPAPSQKKESGRDAAMLLLQGILKKATREKTTDAAHQAPAEPAVGAIHTAVATTAGFSMTVELTSWKSPGRLELGPYQGAGRDGGYRLIYVPGKVLTLARVGARGSSVVDTTKQPVSLEDKQTHRLEWGRHADGAMTVSLDGAEVISTSDRGVRGGFDGVLMVNRGGDFLVKRIAFHGTE